VTVDSKAASNAFVIERAGPGAAVLVDQSDPFEVVPEPALAGELDKRVPLLVHLCRSLWDEQTDGYAWYRNALDLWSEVENMSRFEVTELQACRG
jgi:hypothetical protein